jgi:pimeloyl-ACP methyl ester carboxylesterase
MTAWSGTLSTVTQSIYLETFGAGPSLVLLHANCGDHRDFSAIAPCLAESGWRVTSLDWPGHGRSPRSIPETAVGFGDRLIDVLEGLGGRHVLLGNSVGGFAALRAAAFAPDLVDGLVLVSPGGFTPRWPGATLACRLFGSAPVAPRAYRSLPRLYLRDRNPGVSAAIERAAQASRSAPNAQVYANVWRSFADPEHDSRALAEDVHCPTLLGWGTRDPILPWLIDGRRARAALPDAEVVRFEGAGHQPFIERPTAFLDRIMPFLSRLRIVNSA